MYKNSETECTLADVYPRDNEFLFLFLLEAANTHKLHGHFPRPHTADPYLSDQRP